mgnify:CR=1 FL=1
MRCFGEPHQRPRAGFCLPTSSNKSHHAFLQPIPFEGHRQLSRRLLSQDRALRHLEFDKGLGFVLIRLNDK